MFSSAPKNQTRGRSSSQSNTQTDTIEHYQDNKDATHTANLALYEILSIPDPYTKRPALPPELIFQILSDPSRWIITHTYTYPSPSPSPPRPLIHPAGGDQVGPENFPYAHEKPPPLIIPSNRSPKMVVRTRRLTSGEALRVRKVVFEVESMDQGWSSYSEDWGSFRNSWTWFEVILRPGEEKTRATGFTARKRDRVRARAMELIRREDDSSDEDSEHEDSLPERRWFIQRNRHAGSDAERYHIEMNADSELVRALQDGDTIEVWGFAKYSGWMSRVFNVSVEIWCVDDLKIDA